MAKYKILKLLICTLLTSTFSFCFAETDSLTPLENYINKNGLKDAVAKIYVYNRCTALFMMFSIQSKNQKDEESIKFTNTARQAYLTMAIAAANATLESSKDAEEASKQNQTLVKKLELIYQNYSENQMDLGKDLFEDKLIGGDMSVCGELLKRLRIKK